MKPRELRRFIRDLGLSAEEGARHLKIFDARGVMVAVVPRTATREHRNARADKNLQATLRRAARST